VDGQQRMITLSLMFAAIYSKLNEKVKLNGKEHVVGLNEDQMNELRNLKRKLVLEKYADKIRVTPQIQNNNQEDYRSILVEAGVIPSYGKRVHNAGNRRIFRAYYYLKDKVEKLENLSDKNVDAIFELLDKLKETNLVVINAESHSDAYMLFESLNNRGVPLTPIDLIKNKLLASFETPEPGSIDQYFESWKCLLDYLGDDYMVQERFFRQYYNAFRKTMTSDIKMSNVKGHSVATRSNLIQIYEKIIEKNPEDFLNKIIKAGKSYSFILGRDDDEKYPNLKKPLLDLERIEGTPSYLLLLYLIEMKDQLELKERHFCNIVEFLVRFFVRRNLMDIPATRDLTKLFMGIIDGIDRSTGDEVVKKIMEELVDVSSKDDEFGKKLEGSIYSENIGVARFILCAIEENAGEDKVQKGLWAMEGKQYVWTIEHILPQGANLPKPWQIMIAGGDEGLAKKLQLDYVDRIGNLTLTGYNPELGNKSFEEKRDRKNKKDQFVGYKSGLYLNKDLKDRDEWTICCIENRTKALVNETLELFRLDR